mmetsp:Transcript_2976/g.12854  ORF Transcript_2976/g.12854 Transcript_2976/m.12854 type:complete len:208 (-) Transcript_2976:307-930(-)
MTASYDHGEIRIQCLELARRRFLRRRLPAVHRESPVNRENLTGDVTRRPRAQERAHRTHLLGLPDASRGRRVDHSLGVRGIRQHLLREWGVDVPRRHRVYPDPVLRPLAREVLGEHVHRRLGHGVHDAALHGHERRDAGVEQHASVARFHQQGMEQLAQREGRLEVDVHQRSVLLRGEIHGRLARVEPDVGDQDVHLAAEEIGGARV